MYTHVHTYMRTHASLIQVLHVEYFVPPCKAPVVKLKPEHYIHKLLQELS